MRLAIANDMKKMVEDITASHHERQKAIGDIRQNVGDMRQNVGDMLIEFQKSHKQMSDDLKKGLKEFNNARIKMNNAFKEEMITHVKDLKSDIMKRLEDYGSDRAEAKNIWGSLTGSQKGIKHKAVAQTVAQKMEATIKEPTPVKESVKKPTAVGGSVKGSTKSRSRKKT